MKNSLLDIRQETAISNKLPRLANNCESGSALVTPADFSDGRILPDVPRIVIIDGPGQEQFDPQPRLDGGGGTLNNQARAVHIPEDVSMDRYQVPIIVENQSALIKDEERRIFIESLAWWKSMVDFTEPTLEMMRKANLLMSSERTRPAVLAGG